MKRLFSFLLLLAALLALPVLWSEARKRRAVARFKFEPRDLWIGLYWDTKKTALYFPKDKTWCVVDPTEFRGDDPDYERGGYWTEFHFYFALIPTLPLHVFWGETELTSEW